MDRWGKAKNRKKFKKISSNEKEMEKIKKENKIYHAFCAYLLSGGLALANKAQGYQVSIMPLSIVDEMSKKPVRIRRTAPRNDLMMEVGRK